MLLVLLMLTMYCRPAQSQVTGSIEILYSGANPMCGPGMVHLDAQFNYDSTSIGSTLLGEEFDIYVDDVYSPTINIGFPFTYYGNTYNRCVLSSNNYISFDTSYASAYSPWSIGAPIPSPSNPLNAVMGPWHDTDPSVSGVVSHSYYGVAPNRAFIYAFCESAMFSCTSMITTSQIILFESDNHIEMHIGEKPLCSSWNSGAAIQGLQNADGTAAVVVPGRNYPDTWTASNEGWKFTPDGAGSYTIDMIPYNPLPIVSSDLKWYADGVLVGTGSSLDFNVTATTEFIVTGTVNTTSTSCSDVTTSTPFSDTLVIQVVDDAPTFTQNNLACSAVLDGGIKASMAGSWGPWNFNWFNTTTGASIGSSTGIVDSIAPLGVGTYNVVVTNSVGCTYTHTYNITSTNPIPNFSTSSAPFCEDASIAFTNLTGDVSLDYMWVFGDGYTSSAYSPNHTYAAAGEYNVLLISSFDGSCVDTTELLVSVHPTVTALASFPPAFYCKGDSVSFTDLSTPTPFSWTWNWGDGTPPSTTQNPIHEFNKPGNFDVTLTANSEYCGSSEYVMNVEIIPFPNVNLGPDTVVCAGMSAVLDAGFPTFDHVWSDGSTNQTTTVYGLDQDVWVDVNDRGCVSRDTIHVSTLCGIYVPNVFTPNADDNNDVFAPKLVHVTQCRISIFNRYGEKIFYTEALHDGWDGTFKETDQPIGSYVYLITGVLDNGDAFTKSGNVALLR